MGNAASQPQLIHPVQEAFLVLHGWSNAAFTRLPGDFSARHYVRLQGDKGKALLMVMPTAHELIPFLKMQEALLRSDIRVPAIYASDTQNGLAIIEDLGESDFNALLRNNTSARELYAIAVDALVQLHQESLPHTSYLTQFTPQLFLDQAGLFLDCYGTYVLKTPFTENAKKSFFDALSPALQLACDVPSSLMLRDFHAANIMYLPDETAHKKAAVIDFQDGGIGPITYDLASLLEDARLDVAPELRNAMLQKYLAQNAVDETAFMRSYHILAVQRHLRILGILAKRWVEKGIPETGDYFKRVWNLLLCHQTHSELNLVFAWLDANIPITARADWKP